MKHHKAEEARRGDVLRLGGNGNARDRNAAKRG